MSVLRYRKGDATDPKGRGRKAIIHCCNDIGGWGSGFVLAISRRWPEPEAAYREWAKDGITKVSMDTGLHTNSKTNYYAPPFKLGQIQPVSVCPSGDNTVVVNMIGQCSTGMDRIRIGDKEFDLAPIRYEAINECLMRVAGWAWKNEYTIHCPRFGAGLAGGDWAKIEDLIVTNLVANDVPVTVYDFQ